VVLETSAAPGRLAAAGDRAAPKGLPARQYARRRLAAAWRALGARRLGDSGMGCRAGL